MNKRKNRSKYQSLRTVIFNDCPGMRSSRRHLLKVRLYPDQNRQLSVTMLYRKETTFLFFI